MNRAAWRIAAALAAVLLVVADTAAWWFAQRALAAGLRNWIVQQQASGLAVTVGGESAGGWPCVATRTLSDLSLRAETATLRASRAVLRLTPAAPESLSVDLPGPVELTSSAMPPSRLTARTLALTVPFDAGTASLDGTELRLLVGPGDQPPALTTVALLHLQSAQTALPNASGDIALVGSAQSIALPSLPGIVLPLGPRIASVAFDAVLHTPLAPPYLTAAALTRWRDADGLVAVRRFAIGYGPLGLSGQGRFTLDAGLQPTGRAALHVVGQTETLDALVAGHVITSHVASAAGAVFDLLAQTPAGGGAPQVDTTLELRDGLLIVAGFPLLRLPRLALSPPP